MTNPRNECAYFYTRIEESFLERRYTDVRIICRDLAAFYCHRVVLAAASQPLRELFDKNLDRSPPIDVNLDPNIAGDTFKLILLYMYSGKVTFVDDGNVYHVLVAGDILQLRSVTAFCLHHLSQKGVPKRWAVPLLLYAFEKNQPRLQATVSRYLLQSEDSRLDLVRLLTPAQLSVLVSYYRPTSHIDEEIMLERMFQWTLPWSPTTDTREEMKTLFMKAAKICQFKYLTERYAERYFEKMMADTGEVNLRKDAPWNAFRDNDYRQQFVLHVLSRRVETPLNRMTLAERGGTWMSRPLKPLAGMEVVREIRSAVIGNRLYWMQSRALGKPFEKDLSIEFHVSSSIDLSVSIHLADPVVQLGVADSWHMCSDGRSTIFTCASNSNSVHSYNCDAPGWSLWNTDAGFSPHAMIWYDRQLYLLGGDSYANTKVLGVLDVRAGTFSRLSTYNAVSGGITNFESCAHRERIYVATTHTVSSEVTILDPVGGKVVSILNSQIRISDRVCRLVSFQDTLLTFFCDHARSTRVGTIDPYAMTWTDPLENSVFTNEDLLDVVVFKP